MKVSQSISLDKIGMCASGICIIHCIALPLIIILGFDSISWIADNPFVELLILGLTIGIGSIAFLSGYRIHRQHYVPVLFAAGVLLIINGESVATEWLGSTLSILGAAIIIYAHFYNHKLRQYVA